jgi:hypothetical protein
MRAIVMAGAALAALGCSAQAQDANWRELYQRGYNAAPEASLAPDDGSYFPAAPHVILAPTIVPISIDRGRARVEVKFPDYVHQRMVIDTGASVMSVSKALAHGLLGRGLASSAGQVEIAQADGTVGTKDRIIIHWLMIGDRSMSNIEAIINPDDVEMLLPFGVLAQAGRFTIDVSARLLIFGGG